MKMENKVETGIAYWFIKIICSRTLLQTWVSACRILCLSTNHDRVSGSTTGFVEQRYDPAIIKLLRKVPECTMSAYLGRPRTLNHKHEDLAL